MSIVTDSTHNRIVFCEGETSSPDIRLWSRILIGSRHPLFDPQHGFRIQIEPMGGKQAAKNFARGYKLATSNENWLIIRDRDLDAEQPETGNVSRWDGKIILTGSTCIESYFLLPNLLKKYTDARESAQQHSIDNYHETLQKTLHQLRDYQAVRWALQALRTKIKAQVENRSLCRAAGQFDLPNRLTDEDGTLPSELDMENCSKAATRLVEQFRDIFQVIDVNALRDFVEDFKTRFDGDGFWSEGFRQWFHGKDVLRRWLQEYPNIGHKNYCQWAAENLEWQTFPDLVEIQRICQMEQNIN